MELENQEYSEIFNEMKGYLEIVRRTNKYDKYDRR